MENPQNYIQLNDKKYANTLHKTGGIGTVATRADIIEKLFNINAIESKDGKLKVTSKRKTNIRAFSKALTSPLMTAEWEEKLLSIEKVNITNILNEI